MLAETVEQLNENVIAFPKLGIKLSIDPIAFKIHDFGIAWYGIIIAAAMLICLFYSVRTTWKFGLDRSRFLDIVIGGLIGGIIGARIYYIAMRWDEYKGDFLAMIDFRSGGLAIYGGIIGAILVGAIVARMRKMPILPTLDIAGICLLLGQGIGRWGNFFNQEAYGINTNNIFGMTGGHIQRWLSEYYPYSECYQTCGIEIDPYLPVHPCFLYESVWCLLGFTMLAIFAHKIRRYDGQIFLIYIGWYGLGRSWIEGLRMDSLMIGNVRISQLLAILCVIFSVVMQIVIGMRVKRMGEDYKMYAQKGVGLRIYEDSFYYYKLCRDYRKAKREGYFDNTMTPEEEEAYYAQLREEIENGDYDDDYHERVSFEEDLEKMQENYAKLMEEEARAKAEEAAADEAAKSKSAKQKTWKKSAKPKDKE